jgi:hypothetical protein
MSLYPINQFYYPVWKCLAGEQLQSNRAMPGLDERNTLSNQNGDNVEPELINFSFVQK